MNDLIELAFEAASVVFCVWCSLHLLTWLKWMLACLCGV